MQQVSIGSDVAIALAETKWWESMTPQDAVTFQFLVAELCIPFDKLHELTEKALRRPVFSHEFAFMEGLLWELRGLRDKPTLQEIVELIPEEKRIVI